MSTDVRNLEAGQLMAGHTVVALDSLTPTGHSSTHSDSHQTRHTPQKISRSEWPLHSPFTTITIQTGHRIETAVEAGTKVAE